MPGAADNQFRSELFRLLLYLLIVEKKTAPLDAIVFYFEESGSYGIHRAVRIVAAVARRHT